LFYDDTGNRLIDADYFPLEIKKDSLNYMLIDFLDSGSNLHQNHLIMPIIGTIRICVSFYYASQQACTRSTIYAALFKNFDVSGYTREKHELNGMAILSISILL